MIKQFLQKNGIFTATVATTLYLLLIIFFYHIDKYLTGLFFLSVILLIVLSFLFIVINLLLESFKIVYNIRRLTFKYCLPRIIYALPIWYTFLSPFKLSSAPSEGKVVLRACFEGTQNQATLKFYRDSTFVLLWSGVFGYSEYFSDTFSQVKDTLFLTYKTEKPYRLGRKILNKNDLLITLDTPIEDGQYKATFYLGYCKGLN